MGGRVGYLFFFKRASLGFFSFGVFMFPLILPFLFSIVYIIYIVRFFICTLAPFCNRLILNRIGKMGCVCYLLIRGVFGLKFYVTH